MRKILLRFFFLYFRNLCAFAYAFAHAWRRSTITLEQNNEDGDTVGSKRAVACSIIFATVRLLFVHLSPCAPPQIRYLIVRSTFINSKVFGSACYSKNCVSDSHFCKIFTFSNSYHFLLIILDYAQTYKRGVTEMFLKVYAEILYFFSAFIILRDINNFFLFLFFQMLFYWFIGLSQILRWFYQFINLYLLFKKTFQLEV